MAHTFGGNSGYIGYSKSRRAVHAENEGKRSISNMDADFADEVNGMLAKAGAKAVSLTAIRKAAKLARPDEWHHTSMYGNKTHYYSAETVARQLMTPEQEEKYDNDNTPTFTEEETKRLREARAAADRRMEQRMQRARIVSELLNNDARARRVMAGWRIDFPEGSVVLDSSLTIKAAAYNDGYTKQQVRDARDSIIEDISTKADQKLSENSTFSSTRTGTAHLTAKGNATP